MSLKKKACYLCLTHILKEGYGYSTLENETVKGYIKV